MTYRFVKTTDGTRRDFKAGEVLFQVRAGAAFHPHLPGW